MSDADRCIPGVPCWVDTPQPDPQAAADFYEGLFGWTFDGAAREDYVVARLGGRDVAAVAPAPPGAPPSAAWNTYVLVEDVEETAARVRDAGGRVLHGPVEVGPSGRMVTAADPAGAVFHAWQAGTRRSAEVFNEHGAVNFNDLHTPDIDGAIAFYGAVFGWETLDLGGGPAMWTLPGYGDHLESREPGMRERMREMGAPAGFEDVVASIAAIPDDQPDTPAHWAVTFAVDDADAAAARAAQLGGEVLVPPFDAPWVRMTVIRDPQGATFTASQFVPPEHPTAAQEGAGRATEG